LLALATVGLCSTTADWYEPDGRLSREKIKDIYLDLVSRDCLPLTKGAAELRLSQR
jgi:hypothetical protein